MIAEPMAALPKVMSRPKPSSTSAAAGWRSARMRSRKPAGLSASSPPSISPATVAPPARLTASRRISGWRNRRVIGGFLSAGILEQDRLQLHQVVPRTRFASPIGRGRPPKL
jgi:hypothetical protein